MNTEDPRNREDPRKLAARLTYARDQSAGAAPDTDPEESAQRTQGSTLQGDQLRNAVVEGALEQAIRRGDFENLPGFGKPLDLSNSDDPDWWIKDKIETEGLTGLGPPALTLRNEDRGLNDRLDAMSAETEVRDTLEDFNKRIKLARFQPRGGPPVITKLRDVDAEVAAWKERRAQQVQARERTAAAAGSSGDARGADTRKSLARRLVDWFRGR